MISLSDFGNGGEINIVNNDIEIASSVFTQAYLCIFGGNIQGGWFGNVYYKDANEKTFNSSFESKLEDTLVNTTSLRTLKSFLDDDLKKLISIGVATEIDTTIAVEQSSRIKISIKIKGGAGVDKFSILYDKEDKKITMKELPWKNT